MLSVVALYCQLSTAGAERALFLVVAVSIYVLSSRLHFVSLGHFLLAFGSLLLIIA